MAAISFQLHHTDGKARRGTITTPHGTIETPVFMPVGTAASVKAMKPEDVAALGAEIILGNTYHLYLRPGHEIVEAAGGLHRFMNWPHAILTDSGGFQVFSMAKLRDISEEGVRFASHIDGSRHMLSPEKSIEIQNALGADIIMAFDECAPYPADREYVRPSMERTTRWLERCVAAHRYPERQALFGIMQGGMYPDLRRQSAAEITRLDLPGYAIGGLSVGEPKELMCEILDGCVDLLPADRPRYLMGVGTPGNIIESVARGVDFFDCVMPARNGRHGHLFTWTGVINIKNEKYQRDEQPIDPQCDCPVCRRYSRAYLRHLFKAEEMLAMRFAVMHNLYFYNTLMQRIRTAIEAGEYEAFRKSYTSVLDMRI